jgi:hypothetical protein
MFLRQKRKVNDVKVNDVIGIDSFCFHFAHLPSTQRT